MAPQIDMGTLIEHREGIAEAFEQGRQRQEDDDQREEEGHLEGRRLLHVLPRLAGIIHAVALGQDLLRDVLERIQCLAQGDPRREHGRNGRGIELLEMVQRLRHDRPS